MSSVQVGIKAVSSDNKSTSQFKSYGSPFKGIDVSDGDGMNETQRVC